jgi:hypothetical protein
MEGSDSGGTFAVAITNAFLRRSRSAAQLNVRAHEPIRRFMALALKAEHFRKGYNPALSPLSVLGEHCRLMPET